MPTFRPGDRVRRTGGMRFDEMPYNSEWTVTSVVGDELTLKKSYPHARWDSRNFELVIPTAQGSIIPRTVGDHLWKDPGHVLESDTGGKKNMRITRYDLLPPEALSEIAACFGVGEEKYPSTETGVPNWLLGMPWSWHVRALETHIQKWRSGVDFDEDDGIHHLAHAATLLMFLMTYSARDIGTDDRPHTAK